MGLVQSAAPPSTFSCNILSDVHLEFGGPLPSFPEAGIRAKHLALLGDIGNLSTPHHCAQLLSFLKLCCKSYSGGFVFLIYGNHECYHTSVPEAVQKLRHMKAQNLVELPNLVFLDCNAFDIPNSDVRILGCCLWSRPKPEAATLLNDFRLINGPRSGTMDLEAYSALHRAHLAWLEQECAAAARDEKRVVVLTHHAPFTSGLVPMVSAGKTLTEAGCLGTDLIPERFNEKTFGAAVVKFWCYGHTHISLRKTVGGINIVANQYGYPQDQSKQWWFGALAAPFSSWTTF